MIFIVQILLVYCLITASAKLNGGGGGGGVLG